MRKTILILAALLGIAPAALAASGPVPTEHFSGDLAQASHRSAPQLRAEAQRKLRTAERRAKTAAERRQRARARRDRTRGPAGGVPPQLEAIARCESGGDPAAIGGGGQFRGKYQFTYATLAAAGGSGDPAAAPEAEQDRRAAQLYAGSGPGQWPSCGR